MRLDYALALQLASLIRSNAGIRDAKVVVRLNALAEGEKPSVSISLSQENPDALPDAEIEKMVRQIISGIEPGQYAITRSQAPVIDDHGLGLFHSVFGVRIFDEEYSRFVSLVLGGLFLFGVLGAALGFLGGYRRATRGDDQRADLPALWQGQQKEMLDVRRDGP